MEILNEKSQRKHSFHEKRCGILLTSAREPNALEACSVEIEKGRPQQQQLTEQFRVYRRKIGEYQLKRWYQRSRNSWIYHHVLKVFEIEHTNSKCSVE